MDHREVEEETKQRQKKKKKKKNEKNNRKNKQCTASGRNAKRPFPSAASKQFNWKAAAVRMGERQDKTTTPRCVQIVVIIFLTVVYFSRPSSLQCSFVSSCELFCTFCSTRINDVAAAAAAAAAAAPVLMMMMMITIQQDVALASFKTAAEFDPLAALFIYIYIFLQKNKHFYSSP